MLKSLDLKNVKAGGWVKNFLKNQADNLTGEIDSVGYPFSGYYWGNKNLKKEDLPDDFFLGGINTLDDAWVPFEQTGYWIDGMVRTGYLTGDERLIEKAKRKIISVIENADTDGYLGPSFLKDGVTWAHSVYFRAVTALFEATGDEKILEALKAHYLRAPLKDVFEKQKNSPRMLYVRNIADIETALWLYGKTGDKRLLSAAEESYKVFNKIFVSDKGVSGDSEMKDLTVKGMLGNRKVNRNHGVTYCEICKLPAVLYKYTGKEEYKKAAVNAFEKLYRDQMIIDGVHSSTEYLNGNGDSLAAHETCDISDLTWALFYLYEITGDPKYGDRIENAVFNAGLGAVDDDFRGEQYFSCPNQVIANDTSNHAYFYRGAEWMSYAPKGFLGCCAGNVHRFMPNFVCKSWFIDESSKTVYPAVYAPSSVRINFDDSEAIIEEITDYPFNESVKFRVSAENPVKFTLKLRVPLWAKQSSVFFNGETVPQKGDFYIVEKTFKNGDIVEISFKSEIEFIENAGGVSVKKGALLYALPIKEKTVVEGLRALNNEKYPHYSLYPESKWNYAVSANDLKNAKFLSGKASVDPWKNDGNGSEIVLSAYELKSWKLKKSVNGKKRLNPRGKVAKIGHTCYFMPKVPEKIAEKNIGEKIQITLVPYGTTRLRIAIFPIIK